MLPKPNLSLKPNCSWLFYLLWVAILAVSVHDGMLVVSNRWTIGEDERNPVGRFLLDAANGEIWLLLVTKAAGTIVVGTALLLVFWARPRLGWTACLALTAVQSALLVVLTFT